MLSAWRNAQADLSLFGLKAFLLVCAEIYDYFFGGNDNSNDENYEINNAKALCEYMIILNVCQPISLRNHIFKIVFRNAIRAPNSLNPDQVPYFVRPDLGQKCLQSSKYHEQS